MTKFLVIYHGQNDQDDYDYASSWDDNFCYFNTRKDAEAFIAKTGVSSLIVEEIQEGKLDHDLWFYFRFDFYSQSQLMLWEKYQFDHDFTIPEAVDLPKIEMSWVSYEKPAHDPLEQAIGYQWYILVEAPDYEKAVEKANARVRAEGVTLTRIAPDHRIIKIKFNIKQE